MFENNSLFEVRDEQQNRADQREKGTGDAVLLRPATRICKSEIR